MKKSDFALRLQSALLDERANRPKRRFNQMISMATYICVGNSPPKNPVAIKFQVLEPNLNSSRCRNVGMNAPAKPTFPPFEAEGVKSVDPGIADAVRVLWENGIETFESCEGGPGHSFTEPTVRFHGGKSEGFRALAIASQHGLRVAELRRYWDVIDSEPVGPHWELTFIRGV